MKQGGACEAKCCCVPSDVRRRGALDVLSYVTVPRAAELGEDLIDVTPVEVERLEARDTSTQQVVKMRCTAR